MKSLIKIDRIMYPKNTTSVEAGDFAILCAEVVNHLEGEKPVIDSYWGTIKLKGNVPELEVGDEFICVYGDGETNKYGTTYEIKAMNLDIDENDPKQMKAFFITVCGESIADRLIELENPMQLLRDKNSEELLKVKGITERKLERIYEKMDNYGEFSYAFSELIPLGLTNNLIMSLCKVYKSAQTVVEKCKTNPYEFIDKVRGISFTKADEIAQKCCLDMDSDIRLRYLILFTLEDAAKNGKTWLHSHQLLQLIDTLMTPTFDRLNSVIKNLKKEGKVMLINKNTEICLTEYFELEKNIAAELIRLNNSDSRIDVPDDWEEKIREIEKRQGWEYTDEQFEGIKSVLFNNITIVTGKAGTGKSTITNAMCEILDDYIINLTCLSAKAAQRIEEITGRSSSTIHRLLRLTPDTDMTDLRNALLYTDILIVDEASMINGNLFYMLLIAITDGTKVVIIGDDGQLQPIGECAVFSDLLTSAKLPIVHLTKIHRQAAKSAIITKSIEVRNQQRIYPVGFIGHDTLGELKDLDIYIHQKDTDGSILMEEIKKCFLEQLRKVNNVLEVQVIVPIKTKGELCTKKINNELQKLYNPTTFNTFFENKNENKIYVNDKVINTKNNYNTKTTEGYTYPIFNGNIGIVTEISKEDKSITINFNGKEVIVTGKDRNYIDLAYAITVHSSQGSQWQSVIMAINMSSYIMLTAELLYTGITRAIEHCDLIATTDAVGKAVRTVEQKSKQTYLTNFLQYAKLN